eukprot:360607-Alexandrium_andersonii.AAC.1
MDNEQERATSNPSMRRRSNSNSNQAPLLKLTHVEKPQGSVDAEVRGSDSSKQRGERGTLAH